MYTIKRNPNELRVKIVPRMKASRDKARIYGKTITATKSTPKSTIEHERGHYALGHLTTKLPCSPQKYAREEIDATKYAYDKTHGKPSHIKMQLRAIVNDLGIHEYHEPAKRVSSNMDKLMQRKGTPETWRDDWAEVKKEFKKVNPF